MATPGCDALPSWWMEAGWVAAAAASSVYLVCRARSLLSRTNTKYPRRTNARGASALFTGSPRRLSDLQRSGLMLIGPEQRPRRGDAHTTRTRSQVRGGSNCESEVPQDSPPVTLCSFQRRTCLAAGTDNQTGRRGQQWGNKRVPLAGTVFVCSSVGEGRAGYHSSRCMCAF